MKLSDVNKFNDYSELIGTKLDQARGVVYFLQTGNEEDKQLHDALSLVYDLISESTKAEKEMYGLAKNYFERPLRGVIEANVSSELITSGL
jgi:hypothetical protein